MSTTGAAPVTVTVSATAASSNAASMRIARLPSTMTPSRTSVRNPGSSNVTSYEPRPSARKRYEPSTRVTANCGAISASPASVTVAPGTASPWASATVPSIDPNVCPNAGAPAPAASSRAILHPYTRFDLHNTGTYLLLRKTRYCMGSGARARARRRASST